MDSDKFRGIPNLKDAQRMWLDLGGNVSHPPGTGEILFYHPAVGRVRVNNRRKDSPRELVSKLRRLASMHEDRARRLR